MIIIMSDFIHVHATVLAAGGASPITAESLDPRGVAGPQLQPAYRLLLPW